MLFIWILSLWVFQSKAQYCIYPLSAKARPVFRSGDVIHFDCSDKRYSIPGKNTITCNNGNWDLDLPVCMPVFSVTTVKGSSGPVRTPLTDRDESTCATMAGHQADISFGKYSMYVYEVVFVYKIDETTGCARMEYTKGSQSISLNGTETVTFSNKDRHNIPAKGRFDDGHSLHKQRVIVNTSLQSFKISDVKELCELTIYSSQGSADTGDICGNIAERNEEPACDDTRPSVSHYFVGRKNVTLGPNLCCNFYESLSLPQANNTDSTSSNTEVSRTLYLILYIALGIAVAVILLIVTLLVIKNSYKHARFHGTLDMQPRIPMRKLEDSGTLFRKVVTSVNVNPAFESDSPEQPQAYSTFRPKAANPSDKDKPQVVLTVLKKGPLPDVVESGNNDATFANPSPSPTVNVVAETLAETFDGEMTHDMSSNPETNTYDSSMEVMFETDGSQNNKLIENELYERVQLSNTAGINEDDVAIGENVSEREDTDQPEEEAIIESDTDAIVMTEDYREQMIDNQVYEGVQLERDEVTDTANALAETRPEYCEVNFQEN